MAGIAMRNIATLFHNEDISPNLLKKFASLMLNSKPLHLEKAEKWYERSLKFDDSQSAYQLGLLYENNFDGTEKGLDMGQTYLGEFYENTKNYEKTIELYSKAAKQKHGYYSHAAQCRLDKLNVTRDDILKYYRNERKYGYIETEENFIRIL
ncbi:hypothetical protein RclHR1_08390005 [Rhizophagus clarus]|uniref:Uncharacterized protein n=1 Tax=Rhizophagus clarus TaxID=94130 RepID=A0A2Z6S2P6_9GLOM|nr:hypothetical protein RclHR1_08390005 [Rhizophagus clarus]